MAKYSEEFKYSIVKKMMPPENQSVSQIARETSLSEATLFKWKKQAELRVWLFLAVNRKQNAGVPRINF